MTIKTVTRIEQESGSGGCSITLTLNHTPFREGYVSLTVEDPFDNEASMTLTYDEFAVLVADAFELSRIWREGRKA